jgi:RNA polymerase sigma factor (sigma-70 family)
VPVEELEPAGADDGHVVPDEALWQAVHELPAKQRGVVLLRFVGDLSHREIAAALGSSEEAARRSLADGLAKLRKEWTPA